MHQTSPGVERAVSAARDWANRLGSDHVRLAHLVLALLDEEEGRPAVLLERVGVAVSHVRERLAALETPVAPPITTLFNAARLWSIAYRHDPEFLTDAFLLAVICADSGFRAECTALGFPPELLERTLTKRSTGEGEAASLAPLLAEPTPSIKEKRELSLTSPPEGEVSEQAQRRSAGGGEGIAIAGAALPPPAGASSGDLPLKGGGQGALPFREGVGSSRADRTTDSEHTFQLPDTTAETDAARVLDVSFNRAREAARVLEDYCRFALDDRFLTEQVKELRHGLTAAAQKLPQNALLAARETLRDVGTTATAGSEYERESPAHVALVNLKRLQESLRSLEEFGKVFGAELARDLEALRYRAYTLERAVAIGANSRVRLSNARLYVLVTRAQCPAALDWTIREAARGGADVFQLREKTLPDRELLGVARNVRKWTREAGALFIVNDRPDVARLCDADGVHLGQDDMSVKDARRIVGPGILIGVSTHSVEQLRQAIRDGADYVGIGPVFPSKTKEFDSFPGLEFVRAASAETALPAFALGGIGAQNIADVVAAGARRVAVSSAVCGADDPEQAARLLKAALPH